MTKLKRLRACKEFNECMKEKGRAYRLVSYSDGTFGIDEKGDSRYEIDVKDEAVAVQVALAWVDGVSWTETVTVFGKHSGRLRRHLEVVRNAALQMAREKEGRRKHN